LFLDLVYTRKRYNMVKIEDFKPGYNIIIHKRPETWAADSFDMYPLDLEYTIVGKIINYNIISFSDKNYQINIEIKNNIYGFSYNSLNYICTIQNRKEKIERILN